ncbi:TonB-dependent receptor [Wenyingzhuangia sp. IMCC45467]
MKIKLKINFLAVLICGLGIIKTLKAQEHQVEIQGVVLNEKGTPISEAYVFLEKSNRYAITNKNGFYKMFVTNGNYKLTSKMIGFASVTKSIKTKTGINRLNFKLKEGFTHLKQVELKGKTPIEKVKETPYNVVAINTQEMANSTMDLSDALEKASGVKIRRTGGVGSSARVNLNGFSGNHVRIFMDGIPMNGFGSAFQMNNIPVNLAERIEVYKGVVPIELGSDALGGAINIITKKGKRTYVDASYSYGSFNTHKSSVNVGVTAKSGLTFSVNAFQNYSDNSYKVKTQLLDLSNNQFSNEEYWFKRFNDKYHNETIIAKVGVVGKKWADRLMVGGTLGNEEAGIQNSAVQKIVYGGKKRTAKTTMGSLEYENKNFFLKKLAFKVTANYSKAENEVIDTLARQYNWAGNFREKNSKGEGVYSSAKFNNLTSVVNANLSYHFSKKHNISINNIFSSYERKNTDDKATEDNSSESEFMKRSNTKNVLGASYRYRTTKNWSNVFFGKLYNVNVTGPVEVPVSTTSSTYEEKTTGYQVTGYGYGTTYVLFKGFQLKTSLEKTYRLPTANELFGDMIVESGDASLKAENSFNYNFNVSYSFNKHKAHHFYVDAGFIYRDTQDYIRRLVDESKGGASFLNHGTVKNIGLDFEGMYSYKNLLSISGNITYQNIRNKEKWTSNNTPALNYNDKMPNVPYLFGNLDMAYNWYQVLGKRNSLTAGYHLNYTNEFFRDWESYGSQKITIPTQLSHDIDITYTLADGKYNIAFEARNITDELLYDNYSLQKPGRSFSVKLRYFFLK